MTAWRVEDLVATVKQLPDSDARKVLDFAQFLLDRPRRDETEPGASTHAHIEIASGPSGPRAVIRSTRVPVSMIIGYIRLGETPQSIATTVLPFLTLAQVYDALSYYHDNEDEIDRALAENTEAASMERLRERLGEEDYYRLTGESE